MDDNIIIQKLLKIYNINVQNLTELNGLVLERDEILDEKKYIEIKELIPELKKVFSSSTLNSLQKTAEQKQAWPSLNILRQLLRTQGFLLVPKRLANGYTKSGIKLYRRIFIITHLVKL